MQVKTTTNDNRAVIALGGRFDFNAHREFRGGYEAPLEASGITQIEVDMGGVDYLDSSALGMLLVLKEKADAVGRNVVLTNCRGMVRQVLDIANFAKLFTIS